MGYSGRVRKIVLIIHDVRSAHNVGSLLRSADGLGVDKVFITGFTPYPSSDADSRLPHVAARAESQIHKTALGAEHSVNWRHYDDINACFDELKSQKYLIAALEQTPSAQPLNRFTPDSDVALVVGNEISGLPTQLLERVALHLQIPMLGGKESFNVAVAGAIALYHLRYS